MTRVTMRPCLGCADFCERFTDVESGYVRARARHPGVQGSGCSLCLRGVCRSGHAHVACYSAHVKSHVTGPGPRNDVRKKRFVQALRPEGKAAHYGPVAMLQIPVVVAGCDVALRRWRSTLFGPKLSPLLATVVVACERRATYAASAIPTRTGNTCSAQCVVCQRGCIRPSYLPHTIWARWCIVHPSGHKSCN